MFPQRIQHRIILYFVFLILIILLVSGWLLHWTVRQSLERELGNKLMAVANAAAVQFNDQEVAFLLQGMGPRSLSRLRRRILDFRDATEVKRIYIFSRDGTSRLDTDEDILHGAPYFNLRFFQQEIESVKNQESTHTILFEGIDGQPTMTGYAPLVMDDQVVGGIGVDGSPRFLKAVNNLKLRLLFIGFVCLMGAVVIGILLARTITRPIDRLVWTSKRIGRGEYNEPVAQQSDGEIGLLTKTMEEMRQGIIERERELKAMLAGVAHEIRNPLGGMELFTGMLTDEVPKDSEVGDHVQRISMEIAHLKHIVESFLDYAKPHEPQREKCHLSKIIPEAVSLVRDQAAEQGVSIFVTTDTKETTILADQQHVKRILLNLIWNAIQAQPDGGKVDIFLNNDKDAISIHVKDEGEGIPPDAQEKMFNPFFTTRETGTGLGLSIVKGLTKANGGSVRLVHSNKDGTEFEIQFPQPSRG